MEYLNLANSKNKIINIAIILCAIILSYNVYKKQAQSIALLKQSKELEAKKNDVLSEIVAEEKKMDLYKKFVNKKDVATIINRLGNIANDARVIINSIKPLEKQDYPVYVRYPFNFSVTARTYADAGKFISKLENSPDIYIVESTTISPSMKEDDPVPENIVLTMIVSTVLFK